MRSRYGLFPKFPSDRAWLGLSTPGFNKGNRETPVDRAKDKVLNRIDELVKIINQGKQQGKNGIVQVLYGDLFFLTMYWVNNHTNNSLMDNRRRNAILSLQTRVGLILSNLYNVPAGGIGPKLKEICGKGVVDSAKSKKGAGITKAWQESYRIIFYYGYAYRYDCLTFSKTVSSKDKLIEVNTKDYYNFMGVRKSGQRLEGKVMHAETEDKLGFNYFYDNIKLCNYVLSDDYKLYLAPTYIMGTRLFRDGKIPQFHSNILNDAPVRCAGTIGIVRGVVKVLTNESGHFHPDKKRLNYVLELLRMVRMPNVDSIKIRSF